MRWRSLTLRSAIVATALIAPLFGYRSLVAGPGTLCPEEMPLESLCPDSHTVCQTIPGTANCQSGPGAVPASGLFACTDNPAAEPDDNTRCVDGFFTVLCYRTYDSCIWNQSAGACTPNLSSPSTPSNKVVKEIIDCL